MTSPEVVANRAGRITARQRWRLLGGEVKLVFLTLIGVAGALFVAPNLGTAFEEGVLLGIAGSIFVAACAATAIGCGYAAAAVFADAVDGRVLEVSGAAHVTRSALPPRWRRGRYAYSSGPAVPAEYTYRLEVGGRTFPLSGPAAGFLLRHDSNIRVFYGPHSGELLSVDRLHSGGSG